MKINLIILFFLISNLVHDVPVATYNFYINTFDIEFEIELHSQDLEKIHTQPFRDSNFKDYLNDQIFLRINNKKVKFEFCELFKSEGHHTISGFIYSNEKIEIFEIINRSFIHEIPNFSNVYYFHQKEKKVRGFRSDVKREKISLKF